MDATAKFEDALAKNIDPITSLAARMVRQGLLAKWSRSRVSRDAPTRAIAKARTRSRNRVRDKIARASRRANLRGSR